METIYKIPKAYVYTVEGCQNEEGSLRKFTIPSFARNIFCDFDKENIAESAALFFYLDNEAYQDISKWPLKFKFQTTEGNVEIEVNLSYAPCFLSTPKKIRKEITEKAEENTAKKPPTKRIRKTATKGQIDGKE